MSVPTLNEEILIGTVQTYNSRKGYGFIQLKGRRTYPSDDNGAENDRITECSEEEQQTYFVHHSGIDTTQEFPVKKLYIGEHVEFDIAPRDQGEKGGVCAVNVRGIFGGNLLCDNGMYRYRSLNWKPRQNTKKREHRRSPSRSRSRSRSRSPVEFVRGKEDWAQ